MVQQATLYIAKGHDVLMVQQAILCIDKGHDVGLIVQQATLYIAKGHDVLLCGRPDAVDVAEDEHRVPKPLKLLCDGLHLEVRAKHRLLEKVNLIAFCAMDSTWKLNDA